MAGKAVFSLEALESAEGDCLLLHYGTTDKPLHLLLDGGPPGVYKRSLKPRLEEIGTNRGLTADSLFMEGMFLTHIDGDHIAGLIELTRDMINQKAPCDIKRYWFNSFDTVKKQIPPELASLQRIKAMPASEHQLTAVIATVPQGISLRDNVKGLQGKVNIGDDELLMAGSKGLKLFSNAAITATLIAPSKARLKALYEEWKKKTAAAKKKKDAAEEAALASAALDESVYNLSSLVMVVETKTTPKKRMLLTGDALSEDVMAGLKMAGLLNSKGKAHFNILKMPHHGSDRNVSLEFLQKITADNYVISADGKNGNPDMPTLKWIAQARGDAKFKVVITNAQKAKYPALKKNITALKKLVGASKVVTRDENELSVTVDLLAPITW